MKVTTNGQVTIPQEIRDQLGMHPGTEVEISVNGTGVTIIPTTKRTRDIRAVIQNMRGKGQVEMSTDQVMALTRGD